MEKSMWNYERQASTSEAEIEEKVDVPYIYANKMVKHFDFQSY